MKKTQYSFELSGDWKIRMSVDGNICAELDVPPPEPIEVKDEVHQDIPLFAEKRWAAGCRPDALSACECSISYSLLPGTFSLRKSDGTALINGVDYMIDPVWGAFGRLEGSALGEHDTVLASYSYVPMRLDGIFSRGGRFFVRQGKCCGATPEIPAARRGEKWIATVFFDRPRRKLDAEQIYPVLEKTFAPLDCSAVERQLAKTLGKLRRGEKVKILHWGDSVTVCSFVPEEDRWTTVFDREIQRRFPNAEIEFVNRGWGGRMTKSFMDEPADSIHNYQKEIVESGADLITLEFVNDCVIGNQIDFDMIYDRIRDDLSAAGAELLLITPHGIRPDWMGLRCINGIDEDPRGYVKMLKRFAEENDYACADVSARYFQLYRQGIPFPAMMVNNINHPSVDGLKIFSDTLLELFPEK